MANYIGLQTKRCIVPTVSANCIADFNNTVAGKLTLNGVLVNYDGTVDFNRNNYNTSISITNSNVATLAGVLFTIVGYNKNTLVTEIINGPAQNATVTTNNLFNKIISISANADIGNPYTIGANRDIAVTLSYEGTQRVVLTYLISCPTAIALWPRADVALYALADTHYVFLTKTNLSPATRDVRLDVLQGATADITIANITAGLTTNITFGIDKEAIFYCQNGTINGANQKIFVGLSIG